MPFLPYINMTHARAKYGCSEEVHQHSLYPSRILPCLLYLDCEHSLLGCTPFAQFPLDWLCLCRLLPSSDTEVVLHQEEGEIGLKAFLLFL